MGCRLVSLMLLGIVLLGASLAAGATAAADGKVKITSRMVAVGIGLSGGDGVLTYKGQDYPFTFQAKGLFRDVDAAVTAAELSGEVFNLKRAELFNGTYHKVEGDAADAGGGSRAKMKNLNGVIVNLASTIEGRKFSLGRDGLSVKLEQPKR